MSLFTGRIACFSPSVTRSFRLHWVRHGGGLVRTPEDFSRANTFFCRDLNDSWCPILLSRSLIVMHCDWILKCISQDFLMPISKFVLDSLYVPHTQTTQPQDEPLTLCFPLTISPSSLETRKRTHDLIDQSFTINQGPPKRRRIHDSSTEQSPQIEVPTPIPQQPSPPSSPGHIKRIDLRSIKIPRTKAAIDQFRKFITARSQTIFWRGIAVRYIAPLQKAPPRIPIGALLSAPSVRSTPFAVNVEYRGKGFSCSRSS